MSVHMKGHDLSFIMDIVRPVYTINGGATDSVWGGLFGPTLLSREIYVRFPCKKRYSISCNMNYILIKEYLNNFAMGGYRNKKRGAKQAILYC